MHIAYLTPEYPHPALGNSGGMGTSIKNLVQAIVQEGHQVTLFIYGQNEDKVFSENLITFHLIKQRSYLFGGFYFYRKYIASYINNNIRGVDLIEAPDWTGITAFMHLKRPLVIRFHGSDTYFCHVEKRKQKFKNAFFESQAVKRARAFIAPTHYAGEVSMKLFNLPLDKLSIIPYGLELENFNNEAPESYSKYQLLNIGTLIRKKGVFQLVKIFNDVIEFFPEAELLFIGADSPDVQTGNPSTWELMHDITSAKARAKCHYHGKIPYDQVQRHIKEAHICVFPSLAETLGMVTIEAMALKKVVVNTNLGWAQDLIDDDINGFMYHPDDTAAYVKKITELFENPELIQSVGNNARLKIEKSFDIKKKVAENLEFYKTVIQ